MKLTHTPTPWRVMPSIDLTGDVGITADGLPNVLGEVFADIRRAGERSTLEARENAAFIVTAVNSHDALAEVARKMQQLTSICADWNLEEVEIDGEMIDVRQLGDEAVAALALANPEASK